MSQSPRYIGLMSGTSVDGVDGVLVSFEPFQLFCTYHLPIPASLRQQALFYSMEEKPSPSVILELDRQYGLLFAACVEGLLAKARMDARDICAIGSHGQTIRHYPNAPEPYSLQVGDPVAIAKRTGICTVSHFRQDDIAVGGQGAPLAPAFHAWFFDHLRPCAVLNIGGIANISFMPKTGLVIGFDTGPGNGLLDAWNQRFQGTAYDAGGRWARSGHLVPRLLSQMLEEDYFHKSAPKSTGKDLFNLAWLDRHLSIFGQPLAPEDVQHTLVFLTAKSIELALCPLMARGSLLVCGGGLYNDFLMETLRGLLSDIAVSSTTDHGLAPELVEASCFAWLARERLAGRPANLPSVTGARELALLGRVTAPAD